MKSRLVVDGTSKLLVLSSSQAAQVSLLKSIVHGWRVGGEEVRFETEW